MIPAPSRASAPLFPGAGGAAGPVPAAGVNGRAGQQFGQPELADVHAPRHGHDRARQARCAQPEQRGDHGMPRTGGDGCNHGVSPVRASPVPENYSNI